MKSFPILSVMIFLPILGCLVCSLVSRNNRKNAFFIANFIGIVNSIFATILLIMFETHHVGFQFVECHDWLPKENVQFSLGVDGISVFFVILSVWLSTLVMFSAKHSIKDRFREYSICCLFLQSLMIGTFATTNLLMFYIFFEGVLIPMFFIIGIWGGENKIYASIKFFLYTLFGSIFLLLAIAAIYIDVGSLEFVDIFDYKFCFYHQIIFWLAFFVSFAVKTPMWPLHTWLPDAHVEAPAGGSVILAGILLKMGGYGLLRFSIKIFPDASNFFSPYVMVLSLIAIIWASLVALSQNDIKKIIAYSSIAHMGIVTFGIFTFQPDALIGSIFQMISHGIVSAALFFCIGFLYERFHTRNKNIYSGVITIMPLFGVMFILFSFASIGLPFTSGFIGEILILISAFKVNKIFTAIACLGMVISASYMLMLVRKVLFGEVSKDLGLDPRLDIKDYMQILSLKFHEKFILIFLSLAVLILGICPQFILHPVRHAIDDNYFYESEKKLVKSEKNLG